MSEETANGKKNPSFGRYLQEIRLKKGKNLDEISEETRIAKQVLKFIENEDITRLPDSVYVRGFLQSYANAVGADGDYSVQSYMAAVNTMRTAAKEDSELLRTGAKFWSQLLLFLAILSCLIFVSVFLISPLKDKPEEKDKSSVKDRAEEQPMVYNELNHENVSGTDSKSSQVSVAGEKSENEPEKMLLRIQTVEETWIKIIVDHQDSKEYNLKPEDHLELEGLKGFNILLGNAGGVRLFLNDKPVPVGGKTGQVVSIKIP